MSENRKPSAEILWRLAANLRSLRKARGYTQLELSRRSGIPNRYISNIEQELKNISLANREALAVGLDCFEEDLLRRIPKVRPPQA